MKKQKTTYFCDRCKAEINSNYDVYRMTFPHNNTQNTYNKDLCQKCEHEFKQWYKSKKPSIKKRLFKSTKLKEVEKK